MVRRDDAYVEALVEIANTAYAIHQMSLEDKPSELIAPVAARQIAALEKAGFDIDALRALQARRKAQEN